MREKERGFALLLVFMLAASVCIYLYMQMPRVAFEAQRAKEELLVSRGEQYKRAIQLFFRKTGGRYPASIEDLENTNGVRFLRHRYKDPMTGKDEWRLIHVGPGGVLTDSVVTKPQGSDKDQTKSENKFISEAPPMTGSTSGTGGSAANLALRQRPSDRPGAPGSSPGSGAAVPTSPDGAFNPQPGQYYQPVQPTQYYPGGQPGQPGQFAQPGQFGQQGQPGQPAQIYPAGQQMQPGQPGQTNQGQPNPFYPPGMVQPQTGQPGQVTGGMITGSGYPGGGQQVAPGMSPQTGMPGTPGAPNPGLKMIQDLLMTPRPGGLPGSTSASQGQTMGGGIAGVASKYEGDSIKVYRDRQKYQEWEFIYDVKEDLQKQLPGGAQGPNPQGQNPLGQNPLGTRPGPRPSTGIGPQ